MDDYSVQSSMEAAFALEMESNAAMRALAQFIPLGTLKQIWHLGYAKGSLDAFDRCNAIMGERQ